MACFKVWVGGPLRDQEVAAVGCGCFEPLSTALWLFLRASPWREGARDTHGTDRACRAGPWHARPARGHTASPDCQTAVRGLSGSRSPRGSPWAGLMIQSVVGPPGSWALGQAAAETLEAPGPLCAEGPFGHGPRCFVPGSAAPLGLGVATESGDPPAESCPLSSTAAHCPYRGHSLPEPSTEPSAHQIPAWPVPKPQWPPALFSQLQ